MIKCQKCGYLHEKIKDFECSKCGNKNPNFFIRIDKEDLEPDKYLTNRDKEWLRSKK